MSTATLSGKRPEHSLAAVVQRVRSVAASARARRVQPGEWRMLVGMEAARLRHTHIQTRRLEQVNDAFREVTRPQRARPHSYPHSEDRKGT